MEPLLTDLFGHLHQGVVALLPQPGVTPCVDLLLVLHICHWLKMIQTMEMLIDSIDTKDHYNELIVEHVND